MRQANRLALMTMPALFVAFSAQAHDPKEHMNDAQKPDCAAMGNMDYSRMDTQDPVMQALMQKCGQEAHADEASHGEDEAGHGHDGRGETTDVKDHDHQTEEGNGED